MNIGMMLPIRIEIKPKPLTALMLHQYTRADCVAWLQAGSRQPPREEATPYHQSHHTTASRPHATTANRPHATTARASTTRQPRGPFPLSVGGIRSV